MAYVISPRVLRVATPNGYVIEFTPKKVTWIPDPALPHVVAAGCIECDEKGAIKYLDDPEPPPEEAAVIESLSPEQRDNEEQRIEAIKKAIAYLVTKGDPRDFRRDNFPKISSITRCVGFEANATEVQQAFLKYQTEGS